MKEYAKSFYQSKAWKDCRAAYVSSVGGLCERCRAKGIIRAGEIVHHTIYLTPDNITSPDITLNWDNLELVCRDCHAQEHFKTQKRYRVDDFGRVIPSDGPLG